MDFYLPNYKVAIEYQGRQHFFEETKYKKEFNSIIKRDLNKIKLCENENIVLFHFTYESYYLKNFNLYNIITDEKILIDNIVKLMPI